MQPNYRARPDLIGRDCLLVRLRLGAIAAAAAATAATDSRVRGRSRIRRRRLFQISLLVCRRHAVQQACELRFYITRLGFRSPVQPAPCRQAGRTEIRSGRLHNRPVTCSPTRRHACGECAVVSVVELLPAPQCMPRLQSGRSTETRRGGVFHTVVRSIPGAAAPYVRSPAGLATPQAPTADT